MTKDIKTEKKSLEGADKKTVHAKVAKIKEPKEKVAIPENNGSIHPEYFNDATVTCACGNKFKVGSVMKEINVEICSNCHPFYTGQEKILDSAGRVEKFKAKRAKATKIKDERPKKKE